ncbi:MAG: hypothetical protein V2A54_03410 [Bacteroidota bacterium]
MKFIYTLILFTVSACTFSQTQKEIAFQSTVKTAIVAFSKQDYVTLQTLVDKKTGVYLIRREGVYDNISHSDSVKFIHSSYNYYSKLCTKQKLNYAELPVFSCEKDIWSKSGLYTDTTKTDRLLSNITRIMNDYGMMFSSAKEVTNMENIEDISRRIVVSCSNGNSLVFYLGYIQNKWRLTIIDQVSDDCSA